MAGGVLKRSSNQNKISFDREKNALEFGYHELYDGYGWYIDKIPQDVFDELGKEVDKIKNDFSIGPKYNERLAGEIKHEYGIEPTPKTNQYIKNLVTKFNKECNYILRYPQGIKLTLENLWVNFMKKYEYNPMHNHSGVFSFVIWYKVPYNLEDERKYSAKYGYKEQNINNGRFEFTYPYLLGPNLLSIFTTPLEVDKSKEGYIAIFPSDLNHTVYPFYTSDEYRISIAGNINITR